MTASAAVASAELVEVFDTVPEYVDYDSVDAVREFETDYRVALGRITKAWGDALLDVAERPIAPLTQKEIRTIDALLERLSDVFEQLNDFERTRIRADEIGRREALREADARILRTLEETADFVHELHPSRAPSLWLQRRGGMVYRRLRRLAQQLRARNQVLRGWKKPRSESHDEVQSR